MKKLLIIILLLSFLTANVAHTQSLKMFGQQLNLGHWSTYGLVGYWRFIEAGNLVDESLFHNHGTITGATWATQGLTFAGDGGKVTIPHSSVFAFTPATPYSVSFWVNVGLIANWDGIFVKGGGSGGLEYAFYVQTVDGGTISFYTESSHDNCRSSVISTDTWYHIVGTWDGTSKKMYTNAVLTDTTTPIETAGASPDDIIMGSDDFGQHFTGKLDNVSIYNIALSASEIQALYINPDLPILDDPIWLLYSPVVPPSGIVPIIQAHTRRRRAG